MKYIKTFETVFTNYKNNEYLTGNRGEFESESLITQDLLEIIGVEIDPNNDWICKYNIDVIEFLKEIFLGKKITFYSKNYNNAKWYTKVIVDDIKLFVYKDNIYISVKINNDWKLIDPNYSTNIYDYDASDKPEHKLLKILKKAKKYNI